MIRLGLSKSSVWWCGYLGAIQLGAFLEGVPSVCSCLNRKGHVLLVCGIFINLPQDSDQPPCSHLSFCKEECQQFKINPEDVLSLRNNSQSEDGLLHSKSSQREASSFKFSVSRLPKWAQAKVTNCNNVRRNPNYTSSEAYSPSSPEVQIPSDHASLSPETLNSQCSSWPRGTFDNIALDNNWLSVYTVCMDALSSPEMQSVHDREFPKIPLSLRQDGAVISKDQNSFGLSSLSKNEKMGLVLDQHVGCNNNDSSWCSEQVSDRKADQLHLDESGSMSKTILEDNLDSLCCEEDSDIFKRHFGSLSNTHKVSVVCNEVVEEGAPLSH